MKRNTYLIFTLLFVLFSGVSYAQITEEELKVQKEKLQKQNNLLKKEISDLNKDLQRNQSESKTSLLYIKNLDNKISAQTKLVRGLTKEKRYIEDEIYLTQLQINKLSRELVELRKEYKEILVKAYKNKSVANKLLFVLSAKNLKQAFHRVKYLQRYSDYQLGKAEEIMAKTQAIEQEKAAREKAKLEKEELLAQQSVIADDLESEKKAKQLVVDQYKKNAGQLTQQITEKQKEQRTINNEINRIIEEEIRLARIRAENDKNAWDEASRTNTIAAFQSYLNEWPNGDYADSAKKNISLLEADNRGWQTARGNHTKAAYQKYLNDFPQGQFASTARLEITKFEDAEREAERQERLAREKAEREAAEANKPVEEVAVVEVETPKREENPIPDPAPEPAFRDRSGDAALSNDFAGNRGRMPWPVNRGQIVEPFGISKHPILGIEINNDGVGIATNKGSSAKAVFDGEVSQIISVPGGNRTVLLRHGKYFTVYGNLSFVSVKKGEKVKRGQDLGRIYTDSNGDTILNFQLRNGTSKQNPEIWLNAN
ncbi:MAG: peptidoglycan DD-metalloendopeptidase family protein [Weeksellaceae bacterium]|nr:peptidoglycan DD-metalloendopeptidase family protein [Weeksellaceae bacterium]